MFDVVGALLSYGGLGLVRPALVVSPQISETCPVLLYKQELPKISVITGFFMFMFDSDVTIIIY